MNNNEIANQYFSRIENLEKDNKLIKDKLNI